MTDPTTTYTPTRVALYANATDPPRRVAVYRWSPDGGVTMELLDEEWSKVAKQYFERGVDLPMERRLVHPREGALFMRALLQPFRMTYYSLHDESTA